jgi:alkanesulfonate monooxygenase SsuD/methylene tetrahydromethanopterin reductase-like flavin-dependent oxidoreductase (luciferase family)
MGVPLLGIFVIPEAERPDALLDQVQLADREGLDLVGIQDHPYQRRFLDTWALLPWLAGQTERVRLFPDVANLPLRSPALMAKAAASIDVLSGGRFELGLGAGAFWEAIGAWGGPVRSGPESVDALEEAIAVIRAVWNGEGTVEGSHYRLAGAKPGPLPAHPIGIWLGAYGPRMTRLTGRLADGWIPSLPRLALEEVPARQQLIDEAARAAGRDPADVVRLANLNGTIADGGVGGWLNGPVDHWVEELVRLALELRFDGFILGADGDPLEQTERFAREIAPAVRAETGRRS